MEKKCVVVTGMGLVSPIGFDYDEMWSAFISGKTGIKTIASIDVSDCKTTVGAEVDTARLNAKLAKLKIKPDDRTLDMTLVATADALTQADLISGDPPYTTPIDAGTIVGTGVGATHSLFKAYMAYAEKGIRGLRPTTVPRCMANSLSAQVSMKFALTGPNYVTVSACASATTAMGTAWRMIRDGYYDVMLTGGSDAVFDPASFASWNNLGVMSKNPDPLRACRPFDAARDGCVLGEGAGILVLESESHAKARGAEILAEIIGYGESSDAKHITSPTPEGQAHAIKMAMNSAAISPSDVSFINAHGTATKANDVCESASIRLAFGKAADKIFVSANKSFLGHTLGASGAIETIATILSLKKQTLPPNLNLDNQDSECNLLLNGNSPTPFDGEIAMKNSFGFGGNNTVLVIKKHTDPENTK